MSMEIASPSPRRRPGIVVRPPHPRDCRGVVALLRERPGPWSGWTWGDETGTRDDLARFLDPDWHDRGSLVALCVSPRPARVAALAGYRRLFDSETAEVTLAVGAPPPGIDLEELIVGELVRRGRRHGLREFILMVDAQRGPEAARASG